MTKDQIITIAAAGLAFLASLIAACVAIYNARFKRWAKERWWQRKADAYVRIIDALSSLAYYYNEHLRAYKDGRDLSGDMDKQVSKHWSQGYSEVKRAAAAGAFLISSEAENALRAFWEEKDKDVDSRDWYVHLDTSAAAASKCLTRVVAAAKKDLEQ